jgi:hypothetical protein
VGASPNASITSEMLAKMLELMDELKNFDRSNGVQPFLLLDWHHSRTRLPFLKYINDDNHPWMVCIGVPYGTHLWQVADAPQLNGSFKQNLTKAKREYIKFKELDNKKFCPTDCIPLINRAWDKSFAQVDYAKKAIRERGWGPLNYVLLDHPKLIPLAQTSTTISDDDNHDDVDSNDDSNDVDTIERNSASTDNVTNIVNTVDGVNSITVTSSNNNNASKINRSTDEIPETEGGIGIVERAKMQAIVDSVNKSGPAFNGYLGIMMEGEALGTGRKRKYELQRLEREKKKQLTDDLTEFARVTSGQLAMSNHWIPSRKKLMEQLQKKQDKETEAKINAQLKRMETQEKQSNNFRKSYQK